MKYFVVGQLSNSDVAIDKNEYPLIPYEKNTVELDIPNINPINEKSAK